MAGTKAQELAGPPPSEDVGAADDGFLGEGKQTVYRKPADAATAFADGVTRRVPGARSLGGGGVLAALLRSSYTVARVDVRRPVAAGDEDDGAWALNANAQSSGPIGFADAEGRTGARVLLERVWEAPIPGFVKRLGRAIRRKKGTEPPKENFGRHPFVAADEKQRAITSDFLRRPTTSGRASLCMGASFDVDKSMLDPCLHVDAGPFSLAVLPHPAIRAEAWVHDLLPRSDLALRVRYECPLQQYKVRLGHDGGGGAPSGGEQGGSRGTPTHRTQEFYQAPASLMVSLHSTGLGLRIRSTPAQLTTGLQFEERMIPVGPNAAINVGGTVEVCQQYPVPEGKDLVRVRLDALGFAAKLP